MLIFLAVVVTSLSVLIAMSFLLEEKIDYRDPKLYIWFICGITLQLLSNYSPYVYLKLINSVIVFTCWAKFIFKKEFKKALVLGLFVLGLCIVSETIIVLIDGMTGKIVGSESLEYLLITNMEIAALNVLLSKITRVKKLYRALVKKSQKVQGKQIVVLCLLSFVIYNIFAIMSYYSLYKNLDGYFLLFSGNVLTLVSAILVYNYFRSRQNYYKMYEKYNLSLESIREYEEILEKQRINSHENRNQLMAIRTMCKNKKTMKYIDALIDNPMTDDEQLLLEANKIPNGGLRGLIYSKLLIMKDRKINYELLVARGISNARIRKIDDKLLKDICLIVGVFIDNAIEAVDEMDEKNIIIEIYKEKEVILISITNNYIGYIDTNRIFSLGYSTKTGKRGYGLPLVEKLVKGSRCLERETTIIENNFVQTLKIKTRKTS